MNSIRLGKLPETMHRALKEARVNRGLSQRELGQRVGLPQAHISAIETGKTVPRFDTLLDLVRVLDFDLVMVPRALVPAVQAMIRGYKQGTRAPDEEHGERPLYAARDAGADDSPDPDEAGHDG